MQPEIAIVTGASRGIGKAIAFELGKSGRRVILISRSEEALKNLCEELKKENVEADYFPCDVSNYKEVKTIVSKIVEKYQQIDILVNNAGITRDKLFMRMKPEDWEDVIRINLFGTFNFTHCVIPYMLKKRKGVIINISSVVGITGNPGQTNYAASKAGIIAFTRSLAKEVGVRGIRVLAVAPGFITTSMTESLPEEIKEDYLKRIALRRFGTPEDVARFVKFLVSNDAQFINGQVFIIDGGMI